MAAASPKPVNQAGTHSGNVGKPVGNRAAFPEQTDLAKNCPEDNVPPDKGNNLGTQAGAACKDNKDPVGAAKAAKPGTHAQHRDGRLLKAARLKRVNRAVSVQSSPVNRRLPM